MTVPATLMFYKASPAQIFGQRELAILQMLEPSFDAAVKAFDRFHRSGSDLLAYVDRLPLPAILVTDRGAVHANYAFVCGLGADAATIIDATVPHAKRLVRRDTSGPTPVTGVVSIGSGRSVTWSVYLIVSGGSNRTAIVHFDLPQNHRVTKAARERFGLSGRQAEVAELMADRLSHREIAARPGIRPNTARRHCEQVLTTRRPLT